ncbi:hypothetical protein [Nocardia sp. NPDC004860]|uniref:hypothetical protein n=1 Tax=Nocardia sp. NPDC004860 TaxID=3154557 RepID=UPI0033BB7243
MNRLYILDVPENDSIIDVARSIPGADVVEVGPYFAVSSANPIVVDRRATGVRHAVWYSWVAGLDGWRISQWNKDALKVVDR